jgi:hypothetical protein
MVDKALIQVRTHQGELVNVAPYVYGNSSRIMVPEKRRPRFADLERMRTDVGQQSIAARMFGVKLSWSNLHELKAGDRLLRLYLTGMVIKKDVIEVNEVKVKEDHRKVVYFTIVFPRRDAGFGGFFTLDEMSKGTPEWINAESGLDRKGETLYLRYDGPADANATEPSKSFFEKIADLASAFQTLVTAWTLAHVVDSRSGTHISHDYYYGQWVHGFGNMHGSSFRHEFVGRVLTDVWMESDLHGVNKVYDDRRNVDLISPLLEQMQEDILVALGKDPNLANVIFEAQAPEYWKRTLEVIFQEYYGPKGIIVLTPAINSGFTRYDRRLVILEGIIRTSNFEGERNNAAALYKKLAGKEFVQ